MTGTLTFDLAEERAEFEAAAHGQDWKCLCWDIEQALVRMVNDSECECTREAAQAMLRDLHETMENFGLVMT